MGSFKDGLTDFVEQNEEKLADAYIKYLVAIGRIYDAVFWFEGLHGGAESLGDKYRSASRRYQDWLESEYNDYCADRAESRYDNEG